ncbi:MAG: TRAP transporter fused permease subunit [Desulfurococcales archaeon]|nr:TRAP transporter fused permease subunit [Desulfurococcales archaeon]
MGESVNLEELEIEEEKKEILKKIMIERGKKGFPKKILFAMAVLLAVIEIYYVLHFNTVLYKLFRLAGFNALWLSNPQFLNQLQPSLGVILALTIFSAILMYPLRRSNPTEEIPWYDWIIAVILAIMPLYITYLFITQGSVEATITRVTIVELIFIPGIMFAVLEATRRAFGWILPLITLFFIMYGFYFAYTHPPNVNQPLAWLRRFFNLIISQNTGVLGIPIKVMVTYVFTFLFFSAVVERMGVGKYITELILAYFGMKPGGPAKVAVISSMLMGMISGSSVANVLTTGTFTIPTMKKAGFPPEVAGAVEPVSSTGGQLMPPIMGAAAFIMAEFIGRPYRDIMIAAALPAVLYFYSIYVFVDKEAKVQKMGSLSPDELPDKRKMLTKLYLTLPIFIIIVTLLKLSPQHAVIASLGSAIMVAWLADETMTRLSKTVLIGISLFLTGLLYFAGLQFSTSLFVMGVFTIIIAIIAGYINKGAMGIARASIESIDLALRNSVPVFLAAASASLVQAMISFTNLPYTLGNALISISHGYLYILLGLTAIFSLILGMGVPTTANYVITSTVLASTVVHAAINWLHYPEQTALMASHMFVFYYGILADITPPVALAAFVGAVLAGGEFWKTAKNATMFGFAKYILPFIFVVAPQLLVTSMTKWTTSDYITLVKVFVSTVLIIHTASSGFTGWLYGRIKEKWLRAILVITAILAVSMNNWLIMIMLVVFGIALIKQYIVYRKTGGNV